MFTSAWGKRYSDSIRGAWVPILGELREKVFTESGIVLHENETLINPCQIIIVPMVRVNNQDITITVTYKTASLANWELQSIEGYNYSFPVYEYASQKTVDIEIPAFTEAETPILLPDNNAYELVEVVQTGGYGSEIFSFFALASPSPRILFGLGWNRIYSNFVRLKRGTFASLAFCGTCNGTGFVEEGVICPECDGFRFSGPNSSGYLLDVKGRDVKISRNENEEDEQFAKRIWARRWTLIPMESEIVRYFAHFAHCDEDAIEIIKYEDLDEPTYIVALDAYNIGTKAIWQTTDEFENWAGIVKSTPPAGVNAYFSWISMFEDTIEIIDDGVDPLTYTGIYDPYNSVWGGAEFMNSGFNELRDFISACSGHYKAWESFYNGVEGNPPSGWTILTGELEVANSFLGHNKCAWAKNRDDTGQYVFASRSVTLSDFYQYDYYICMLDDISPTNYQSVSVHLQSPTLIFGVLATYLNGQMRFLLNVNGVNSTVMSGLEILRWYHVHAEATISTGQIDVYIDGVHEHSRNVGTGVLIAYPSCVIASTSGAYCGFMVDAIDGSWDGSYCAQSDGSVCVTRNMVQVSEAPGLNNSSYPSCANPVTGIAVNHWVQGFEHVDEQSFKWMPYRLKHEAVIQCPSGLIMDPGKYGATIEYWKIDGTPIIDEDFEGYTPGAAITTGQWSNPNENGTTLRFYAVSLGGSIRGYIYDNQTSPPNPRNLILDFAFTSPSPLPTVNIAMEVDFEIRAITSPSPGWTTLDLRDEEDDEMFGVRWEEGVGIEVSNDGGYILVSVLTLGQDYHVRLATFGTNQHQVWIDGDFKGTFTSRITFNSGVNSIHIETNNVSTAYTYIDNIEADWTKTPPVADAPFVHRRVVTSPQLRKIYDNHLLVEEITNPPTSYDLKTCIISGITMSDYPYMNMFGGRSLESYRTQRTLPNEFTLHGIDIGIVDEWKGISLPYCIRSNNTVPHYIEDAVDTGNENGSWEAWVHVDPAYNAEFSVEFHGSGGLAWRCYLLNGNLYNNSDTLLCAFGNKAWHHLLIDYNVSTHLVDITVDGVLLVTNDTFTNNTEPFTKILIGWMSPCNDSIVYIAGMQCSEISNVDESTSELSGDGIDLQSAISYRTNGIDCQSRQQSPEKFLVGHHRTGQSLLSILAQEKMPSRKYALSWIGDKLISFNEPASLSKCHKATYNFDRDIVGEHPKGCFQILETGNVYVQVIQSLSGHEKVLKISDSDASGSAYSILRFENRVEGVIELWIMSSSVEASKIIYISIGSSVTEASLIMNTGHWTSHLGAFDGNPAYEANRWYHVKIQFDCVTDVANIWIDGVQLLYSASADIPFTGTPSAIKTLDIHTVLSHVNYDCHIDAIGFSWDPLYNIGDNLKYDVEIVERMLLQPREFSSDFTTKDSILWTRRPIDIINHEEVPLLYKAPGGTGPLYMEFSASDEMFVESVVGGHKTAMRVESGEYVYRTFTSHTSGVVEMWVYDSGDDTQYYEVAFMEGSTDRFTMQVDNTNRYMRYNTSAQFRLDVSTYVVSGTGWHHLYMDYDGSNVVVYMDGVLLYDSSMNSYISYISSGDVDRLELRCLGTSGYDAYFDAIGISEDSLYAIGGNRYPWEGEKANSIVAYNKNIVVDGKSLPYKICEKDSILLVSKGLNNIS